jgi:hypothetical protein
MKTKANKTQPYSEDRLLRSSAPRQPMTGRGPRGASGLCFRDARPTTVAQRKLQESIDRSPRQSAQAELLSGLFGTPVQKARVQGNEHDGAGRETDVTEATTVRMKRPVIQKCTGKKVDGVWRTFSSFSEEIRLDKDVALGKVGNGGALTVFLVNTGVFDHRIVALEWYDGLMGTGKEIVAHLVTPNLQEGSTAGKAAKQIGSLFGYNMKSKVEELPFRESSREKRHRTVPLTEEKKEEKRDLLEGELGKSYDYNLASFSCYDWAKKVADEAIL